jgi:uroporphyrinogen decarboxylase
MTALRHREPDRVPLDMMGNATMLVDETYLNLRDYLGLSPIAPIRSGTTANYYDERILEYFDIDFRRIFLKGRHVRKIAHREDNSFYDAWGIGYKQEGIYVNVVSNPLKGVETVEEIDAYSWPKAEEMFSVEGLAEEAERLYKKTDYAIVARNPLTAGFLDRANQLMGMSDFLTTLIVNPEMARCLLKHLLRIYKGIYAMFLDAVVPYVQVVETGDDLGTQESLLISPDMYRDFIKPLEEDLYSLIQEKTDNAVIFRHVDGAIYELIPDLIEVGVGILNPTQTSAKGMDAARLQKAYGHGPITFHGAIENMQGSVEQLIAEVKEKIDVLAPGGGYILASCNHMIEVKPENIVAMFETAREYGRYG